jgi:CBS domain-containing protein
MGKSVRDTMTNQPTSIDVSQSVGDAARVMRDEDVGSLPVTDQGRLIGVITDRDIAVRVVAEGRADSATVADALSRNPVTVTPEHDLDDALKLMARHQVRRLPVVEDERLVGIVAQADVALVAKEKQTGELVESISER